MRNIYFSINNILKNIIKKTLTKLSLITIISSLLFFFTNCKGTFHSISINSSNQIQFAQNSNDPAASSGAGDMFIAGKKLYNENCSSCHGTFDQTTKQNRTYDSIINAISNISQMFFLKNLDKSNVQLIAQALNGMGSGNQSPGSFSYDIKTNPYLCNSQQDPGNSETRRLSKKEYIATLELLFPMNFSKDNFQLEIDSIPDDVISNLFSTTDNSVSINHIQAYSSLSLKLATHILDNPSDFKSKINCSDLNLKSDNCYSQFTNGFAKLILRRPLTNEEINNYKLLYNSNLDGRDAWISVLASLLQSPSFIYKTELNGQPINNRNDLFKLNQYEIAARLAFYLTGRGPDEQLFQDAEKGNFNDSIKFKEIALRLLETSDSKKNLMQFYQEYFSLDRIPIPSQPEWFINSSTKSTLRSEAKQEILDIAEYYTWKTKGTLADLLTTNKNFTKGQALSSIYNIDTLTLSHPNHIRDGVTTRVGFLLGQGQNASLVHRGLIIRRNFLCEKIPPPSFTDVDPKFLMAPSPSPTESTRIQIEKRTSDARCMACHAGLNPMGFSLESYDAVGRFRSTEKIFDSSGIQIAEHPLDLQVNPNINSLNDPIISGANELNSSLAKSSRVAGCFTEQLLTYSKGRDTTIADSCTLQFMYNKLISTDPSSQNSQLLDFFLSVVLEPHFQYRKASQ